MPDHSPPAVATAAATCMGYVGDEAVNGSDADRGPVASTGWTSTLTWESKTAEAGNPVSPSTGASRLISGVPDGSRNRSIIRPIAS